jgi:hypothetical protein
VTMENKKDPPSQHTLRLPGFLIEEEVGLGDLIKRTTSAFGIRPCGGCERRAAILNRWLTIRGPRTK